MAPTAVSLADALSETTAGKEAVKPEVEMEALLEEELKALGDNASYDLNDASGSDMEAEDNGSNAAAADMETFGDSGGREDTDDDVHSSAKIQASKSDPASTQLKKSKDEHHGKVKKQKQVYYAVRVGYAACPACLSNDGDSLNVRNHYSVVRSAIFLSWEDVRHFVDFSDFMYKNSHSICDNDIEEQREVSVTSEEEKDEAAEVRVEETKAEEGQEAFKGNIDDKKKITEISEGVPVEIQEGQEVVKGDTEEVKGDQITLEANTERMEGDQEPLKDCIDKEEGSSPTTENLTNVPFYSNVEYRAFYSLAKAELYLKKTMKSSSLVGPLPKQGMPNKTNVKNKTAFPKISLETSKLSSNSSRNRGRPTKKWENMYQLASAFKATHGHLNISSNDEQNSILYRWIRYQRLDYRYYLEDPVNGPHSMTPEKLERLKKLRFEWIILDDEANSKATGDTKKRGRPRSIGKRKFDSIDDDKIGDEQGNDIEQNDHERSRVRQKWFAMFEKLKKYKSDYGTVDIPKDTTDSEHMLLLTWCTYQKNRYAMMLRQKKGKEDGSPDKGMTQEQVQLLTEIGFQFPPSWEKSYSELLEYKKKHNNINVSPYLDTQLHTWVVRQHEMLKKHLQGKPTRLSDEQAMRLLSIGFQGKDYKSSGVHEVADPYFDDKWNEMLIKLREYKNKTGHCNVPTSLGTDLSNWVATQRRMYSKLSTGKHGRKAALDAVKMQRLTEIGFQFRPRGSYMSWDDQIDKLRKFKEEHGHCHVPVSHPILGSFIKLARREHKLKQQGEKSSMTDIRERELQDLGFVFEGGKTPERKEVSNKSWDERFDELIIKKSMVTQWYPKILEDLGNGFMRVNYKRFKAGKTTSMTAEKALKLIEMGFCFNASDKFRGNKHQNMSEHLYMYHQVLPNMLPF